jgi:hypothetical protein
MKFRVAITMFVLTFALPACGGGGGSAGPAPAPAQPAAPITPATGAPTSPPATAPQSTAQITLTIPALQSSARGRSPQFVSPNSGLFRSTVVSVNGSTTLPNGTPAVLTTTLSTAAGGNCQTPPFTTPPIGFCVVTIQAPTGTVVYQFDLFDKSGALRLSTANPTFTMPATGLHAQMQAIVASVLLLPPAFLTYGQAATVDTGATAQDASGALIFGTTPYWQPYTLCDSDTSGHTTLAAGEPGTPGSGPVRCVAIPSHSTSASLNYDGAQIPPITITASGAALPAGGISRTIYPEPRIVLSGTVDERFNTSGLTFSGPGQTKSFTATQTGHTGPFRYDDLCRNEAVAVTTKDFITFTVIAQASGSCTGVITGLQDSIETVVYTVP